MIPHHTVTGPEDAPLLVLSNSLGATLEMWDPQADALAERFRLVRYDTRGHGGSAIPPGPYSIDDVGGDVVALLDHLGIERAHFAGLSLGGMTGCGSAHQRARARSTGWCCCAPSAKLGPPESWADRADDRARAGHRRDRRRDARALAHRGLPRRAPDLSARARDVRRAIDDEGYASCCAVIAAHGPRPRRSTRISAPTLVIAGAQDPATPPRARRADRRGDPRRPARGARPGAHLVNVERPEAVDRADPRAPGGADGHPLRGRHEGPPRGARRRARRPRDRQRHRLQPPVPGVHHPRRVGRGVDAPGPGPQDALVHHARDPHRAAGRERDPDARARRDPQRPHAPRRSSRC